MRFSVKAILAGACCVIWGFVLKIGFLCVTGVVTVVWGFVWYSLGFDGGKNNGSSRE